MGTSNILISDKTRDLCGRFYGKMTIDPGFNGTGWSYWNGTPQPITGRFHYTRSKSQTATTVHQINSMVDEFDVLVKIARDRWKVSEIIIEGTDFRPGSFIGRAAAVKGDISKLSYLVGSYIAVCHFEDVPARVIEAKEWKGNLPKEVVGKRIAYVNGVEYKEHEEEAVGMGFGLMGIL